jgi:cytochrome c oxidase subunit 3
MSSGAISGEDYFPQEHAPDPLMSHGDPTPPGKVGIWLFLASEVMFFIGILGTYIILRSGQPLIFGNHAAALSKGLAGLNTLVLILSSLTMALAVDGAQRGNRGKTIVCLAITLLMAFGFMGIKAIEYANKFTHYTVVAKEADGKAYIYDGHAHREGDVIKVHGYRAVMSKAAGFNINLVSERDVERAAEREAGGNAVAAAEYEIPAKSVVQQINYGPWKNIFYASYFALTGVHGLHVIGGILPITFLLVFALRGRLFPHHTEYVGLYWHFVDLVWIFLFPLLYLI